MMKRRSNIVWLMFILGVVILTPAAWADFFKIKKIKYHDDAPRDKIGVWENVTLPEKDKNGRKKKETVFAPCLEVEVEVEKQTKAAGLKAKAYYFKDAYDKHVAVLSSPSKSGKPGERTPRFIMPVLMEAGEEYKLFFAVPEKLRDTFKDYEVVVVFGDQYEIAAKSYPSSAASPAMFTFAEKQIYQNPSRSSFDRKEVMDPVTKIVVKTKHPKHPQLTMFVRPPKGMTDGSRAKGILAWCVLANKVEDIHRKLQGLDDQSELSGLTAFADKHQLAILAWGTQRGVWDKGKNYDELSEENFETQSESFDLLADAWEDGVDKLHKKYGLPNRNFYLSGISGAAQWAHRMALRKPEYFHAVQIHIPSSFDIPTPEASQILWCVTTGELESGYERSKRFFMDCKKLGYPITYKAYMGLGHSSNNASQNFGLVFLEYAAGLVEEREKYQALLEDTFNQEAVPEGPWPESYRNPEFVGDIVNQELFPVAEKEMVPKGFQVPLPSKRLADAWKRQN